ncbi:MAG: hypothetical protein ABL973_01170 [Micropepsaceae bacterium]
MIRTFVTTIGLLFLTGVAFAEENVSIRGNFPQLLARGETTPQMANRIAVLLINLDRLIAPPCGMKRTFEFAGADYVDADDLSVRVDPARPGVWRFLVIAHGCWANRAHNVFVYPRGAAPADLRAGVPGRSVAGLKYQQQTLALVFRLANGMASRSHCDERAFISDTNVSMVRKPDLPWQEIWSATACEVTRKFLVMFAPEAGKMRISVVPNG